MAREHWFSRRQVMAGALGAGVTSLTAGTIVRAQTAASPAGSASRGMGTATAQYDDFVGKLAANLGNLDVSRVDTAIRTSLKQMVDARLAAGSISANTAVSLKQQIDSSAFPAGLRCFDPDGGFCHDDDHDDDDDDRDDRHRHDDHH